MKTQRISKFSETYDTKDFLRYSPIDRPSLLRTENPQPSRICETVSLSTFTHRLNFGSGLIRAAPPLLRARSLLLNLYLRLFTFCSVELSPVLGLAIYQIVMPCPCLTNSINFTQPS